MLGWLVLFAGFAGLVWFIWFAWLICGCGLPGLFGLFGLLGLFGLFRGCGCLVCAYPCHANPLLCFVDSVSRMKKVRDPPFAHLLAVSLLDLD